MEPIICARCKKNVAVLFITKMENGQTTNEGLCMKCARELKIKPVDDMIKRMGLSDEELDALTGDMAGVMGDMEGLMLSQNEDSDMDDEDGKTALQRREPVVGVNRCAVFLLTHFRAG